MNSTKCRIFPERYAPKFLSLKCTSLPYWEHSLFAEATGRSCEFGEWGWDTVRAFGTHGRTEASGNRKGHFSTFEQSCTSLSEELAEIGVSCSPPTKQTRDKPLCWMRVKTLSSEIRLMLWQSVSVITNTLFRKMGPFRLQNYCFKPSSYTIEEDNAGFISAYKATVPMFYVLVVRKW